MDRKSKLDRRLLAGVILVSASVALLSGCASRPSESYRILFGNSESRISSDEKGAAFAAFSDWLTISADGLRLEDQNCGDIAPEVEIVDLNRDGTQEIFILWGNTCTSGMTGRSLTLLIRDSADRYRQLFGFPAAAWSLHEVGEGGCAQRGEVCSDA
jgi:hypothetical protein